MLLCVRSIQIASVRFCNYRSCQDSFRRRSFLFSLIYNSRYPAEPPQAFFETPIYHPNVSCLGVVGLDLLLWMWSPEIRMKNILERLVCRLERPDMRCTWNVHATTVFLHNNAEFHSTASEWTKVFAKKQTLTQINQWRIIRDIMKKMQLFYSCWFFKKQRFLMSVLYSHICFMFHLTNRCKGYWCEVINIK